MTGRKQKNKILFAVIAVVLLIAVAVGNRIINPDFDKAYTDAGLRDENSATDGIMYVNFIDVGQGDCTLITCGETAILIDGGESSETQTVVNYLKNQNVSDIDCCIATHPHSDHIGSLAEVFNTFEVKNIIMPKIPEKIIPTSSTYEKFLKSVSKNVDNVIAAKAGSTYSYGDINIEIYAPLRDYDDINNMSVVAKISYGTTSVMMTGDAETTSEKDMLNKKSDYSSDILKVGHHGSRTSTSSKWLDAVNPKYAVISCGKNNDYGHPHPEVITRLEKHNVKYFRTDLLGNIVFESDGKVIKKCA